MRMSPPLELRSPARGAAVRLATLGLVLLAASGARAEYSAPRLLSIFPPGGRQGTTLTVEIQGGGLEAPSGLYFSHSGIKGEWISPDAPKEEGESAKDKGKGGRRGGDGKALRYKVT